MTATVVPLPHSQCHYPTQDTGRPDHLAALAAAVAPQAGAVVADYDQVRTWSDPSARQCELARLGAAAVELLRQLGAATDGAGAWQERARHERGPSWTNSGV